MNRAYLIIIYKSIVIADVRGGHQLRAGRGHPDRGGLPGTGQYKPRITLKD